jgi:hypothetical protein
LTVEPRQLVVDPLVCGVALATLPGFAEAATAAETLAFSVVVGADDPVGPVGVPVVVVPPNPDCCATAVDAASL